MWFAFKKWEVIPSLCPTLSLPALALHGLLSFSIIRGLVEVSWRVGYGQIRGRYR